MPAGLVRFQSTGQTHFVTFSCYHRKPKLTIDRSCEIFLRTLETIRQQFAMRVYGYVLMPEHVHLLASEPESLLLADAIHALKLSTAKQINSALKHQGPFWQTRYYDRNIRSYSDFVEKLRYIHRNPLKRGLCQSADEWPWSSFQHYASATIGVVEIESLWTASRRRGAEVTDIPG